MKKDKQKVLDEVWTEERIRGFLDLLPPDGTDADFHRLFKAYQSMRADDFSIFVEMAVTAGLNLQAVGPDGQTVREIASRHRMSGEFVVTLEEAGG